MRRRLDTVARLLDPTADATTFDWASVDFADVTMVKSTLGQQMKWTSANALLEDGYDLEAVGKQVGHTNPKTTMRYSRRDAKKLQQVAVPFRPFGDS